MNSLIQIFAKILGTILSGIYGIIGNYGWALIIFVILYKVITFPMALSQKRTAIKSERLGKKSEELKKKYENNQEKYNEELIKLYQEENVSPCSSCLSFIFQMILLFAMLTIVTNPLTYVKNVEQEKIEEYQPKLEVLLKTEEEKDKAENQEQQEVYIDEKDKLENDDKKDDEKDESLNETIIQENKENNNIQRRTIYDELYLIRYFGKEEEAFDINTDFFGINLTLIPKEEIKSFEDAFKLKNIKILIIPIIYIVVSLITNRITIKDLDKDRKDKEKNKAEENINKEEDEDDLNSAMADATKNMTRITPILIFIISMVTPLAMALYWLMNTIMTLIERKLVNIIIEKDEVTNEGKVEIKKIEAKEVKKLNAAKSEKTETENIDSAEKENNSKNENRENKDSKKQKNKNKNINRNNKNNKKK